MNSILFPFVSLLSNGNKSVTLVGIFVSNVNRFVTDISRYPDEKVTIIILSNQQTSNLGLIHEELVEQVFEDD